MASDLLLILYGLCCWGAALNFPAWAALFWQRWRSAPHRGDDVYLIVRIGLVFTSFGTAGLSGVRVWGELLGTTPLSVPSWMGVVAIGCMAFAEPFYLRVDEIYARAAGKRSWGWRLYWVGGLAWILFVAWRAQ